jgi:CBS domain-containing protein
MKCTEIMTLNPKMCVPDDDVYIAAEIMWDCDCGAVLVVNDMESGELVGIVTDRDIAMYVVRHAFSHPAQVRVADCMSSPAVACHPEDLLEIAVELMTENKIRRIPVIDENGACVGIISQADLVSRASGMKSIIAVLQQISTPHSEKNQEESVESEVEAEAEPEVKSEPEAEVEAQEEAFEEKKKSKD